MADSVKMREDAKKEIRSLLLSAPVGLTLRELERDYFLYFGKKFRSSELGYSSTEEFLKDIPDAVEVTPRCGTLVLSAVADASTKHIQRLVSCQKLDTRRNWDVLRINSTFSVPPPRADGRNRMRLRRRNGTVDSWRNEEYSEDQDCRERVSPTLPDVHCDGESVHKSVPSIPSYIIGRINEIVRIYVDGVPLTHFGTIFSKHCGFALDPQQLGFSDMKDLLASLTDVVELKQLSAGETWVMLVTAEAKQGHQTVHSNHAANNITNTPRKQPTDRMQEEPVITPKQKHPDLRKQAQKVTNPGANLHKSKNGTAHQDRSENIPLVVQDHLKQIMTRRPNGTYASRLSQEYKEMFKQDLPHKKCGCNSVIEFVANLPEIIRIERPEPQGDWILLPANSEASPEISSGGMVKQPDTKGKVCNIQVDDATKEAVIQVLSMNNDVPLQDFESVFEEMTGHALDFSVFGASDLKQFLHSMPDIVLILLDADDKAVVCLKANGGRRKFHRLKDEYQPTIVPSEQVDDTLLRLPSDAIGPGCFYTKQDLPDFGDESQYLSLYVSNIISPDVFWIQVRGRNTTLALEDLMDDMATAYKSRHAQRAYNMTPGLARRGLICLAIFPEDGHWYRAIITGVKDQLFEVFYVDYGNTCYVSITQMKLLRTKFLKLPAQAIQARLSNIKPATDVWRLNSRDRFLALSRERPLVGLVTNVKDGVVSLCLTDTSQTEDIHINDLLVEEGYAIFAPDTPVVNVVKHTQAPSSELLYGKIQEDLIPVTPRRYIRQAQMADKVIMNLINLGGELYLLSSEISNLFFATDILCARLATDGIKVPNLVLTRRDHTDLFKELATFGAAEVTSSTNELILFKLSDLPLIIERYDIRGLFGDVKDTALKILQCFDIDDPYWKGEDNFSEAGTPSSGSDSSDVPDLSDLQLALSSLEVKRKRILASLLADNKWSMQIVDELNVVEQYISRLHNVIAEIQNTPEQPTDSHVPASDFQNKISSDQAHSSSTSTEELLPHINSVHKNTPVQQPLTLEQPQGSRIVESLKTWPDVTALLQENMQQILKHQIGLQENMQQMLMQQIGLSQQNLLHPQNLIGQSPLPVQAISRLPQPHLIQPNVMSQPQNKSNAVNVPNPVLPFGAYHNNSLLQNQWPQESPLMPQLNHLRNLNMTSRLALMNLRSAPQENLSSTHLPSPAFINPSFCANPGPSLQNVTDLHPNWYSSDASINPFSLPGNMSLHPNWYHPGVNRNATSMHPNWYGPRINANMLPQPSSTVMGQAPPRL